MIRADITGQRFGRLVAIRLAKRTKTRGAIWLFRCDCGTEKEIQPSSVRRTTHSCGCLRRELYGAVREHRRDGDGVFCVALDHGRYARIDDLDIERVTAIVWYIDRRGFYAITKAPHRSMHRLIIGAGNGQLVDHINGDPLDNRRANLRLCDARSNAHNRRAWGSHSRFKGVTRHASGKWQAQIGGRYLGLFDSEEVAARTADAAARIAHGAFARLNFHEAAK